MSTSSEARTTRVWVSTDITFTPANTADDIMAFDEWLAWGDRLRRELTGVQFSIGDWLNYGEAHYGEKYAQALNESHYAYSTLRAYSYLAHRYPREKRVFSLSFTHYKMCAGFDDDKAYGLLAYCECNEISTHELGVLLRGEYALPPASKAPQLSTDDIRAWACAQDRATIINTITILQDILKGETK